MVHSQFAWIKATWNVMSMRIRKRISSMRFFKELANQVSLKKNRFIWTKKTENERTLTSPNVFCLDQFSDMYVFIAASILFLCFIPYFCEVFVLHSCAFAIAVMVLHYCDFVSVSLSCDFVILSLSHPCKFHVFIFFYIMLSIVIVIYIIDRILHNILLQQSTCGAIAQLLRFWLWVRPFVYFPEVSLPFWDVLIMSSDVCKYALYSMAFLIHSIQSP